MPINIGVSPPDNEKMHLTARTINDVLLALHFDQARDRAPELEGAVAGSINFFRRHFGRGDQQGARLVERVDEDVEASRLVALLREKAGDAFDDDRREAPCDR